MEVTTKGKSLFLTVHLYADQAQAEQPIKKCDTAPSRQQCRPAPHYLQPNQKHSVPFFKALRSSKERTNNGNWSAKSKNVSEKGKTRGRRRTKISYFKRIVL